VLRGKHDSTTNRIKRGGRQIEEMESRIKVKRRKGTHRVYQEAKISEDDGSNGRSQESRSIEKREHIESINKARLERGLFKNSSKKSIFERIGLLAIFRLQPSQSALLSSPLKMLYFFCKKGWCFYSRYPYNPFRIFIRCSSQFSRHPIHQVSIVVFAVRPGNVVETLRFRNGTCPPVSQ
jgi:hypothetical protein